MNNIHINLSVSLVHRNNHLGPDGWDMIGQLVERLSKLESFNGCNEFKKLVAGGLTALDIDSKELALCISRFFERSASTLTSLSMR